MKVTNAQSQPPTDDDVIFAFQSGDDDGYTDESYAREQQAPEDMQ